MVFTTASLKGLRNLQPRDIISAEYYGTHSNCFQSSVEVGICFWSDQTSHKTDLDKWRREEGVLGRIVKYVKSPISGYRRRGELKRSCNPHNQTVISHQVGEGSVLLNLLLHPNSRARSAWLHRDWYKWGLLSHFPPVCGWSVSTLGCMHRNQIQAWGNT